MLSTYMCVILQQLELKLTTTLSQSASWVSTVLEPSWRYSIFILAKHVFSNSKIFLIFEWAVFECQCQSSLKHTWVWWLTPGGQSITESSTNQQKYDLGSIRLSMSRNLNNEKSCKLSGPCVSAFEGDSLETGEQCSIIIDVFVTRSFSPSSLLNTEQGFWTLCITDGGEDQICKMEWGLTLFQILSSVRNMQA